MKKVKVKKAYEKPKVVYERTLEVLAGVCSPPHTGSGVTCKVSSGGGCNALGAS